MTKTQSPPSCSNCRFGSRTQFGFECRRHAPSVRRVGSYEDLRMDIPQWPIMKAHDWCGDWSHPDLHLSPEQAAILKAALLNE